jgi:hypothetical protein
MSAKAMLAMAAGTGLFIYFAARRDEPREPPAPERPYEVPWLTRDAAAQIIARGGGLGPLFDGLTLGGSAPSPEVRARIAAFARAHHVAIDLDVVDDELAAVRFEVTFAGGYGYEGADVLALRLGRPSTGKCCVCGPDTWIDDWAIARDDGVYMRGRVRVNRVAVRWERVLTLDELLERADGLLGMTASAARERAGDRWIDREDGTRRLEVPYPFADGELRGSLRDTGLHVTTERARIVEVSFALRDLDAETVVARTRARWGQPRVTGDGGRTWRKRDRTIHMEPFGYETRIAIRRP